MSWHCSQALVAAFSAATCLDGARSAPSNTTHTPAAYYWPDKTTEHSRLSRFGMTSELLTADRGADLLTWYLAGFHAQTLASPSQSDERVSMARLLDSGETWPGSFARYDRGESSWRTHQTSLMTDLDEFSETWPRWGFMLDGECWELNSLEETFSASVSGLLPAPTSTDYKGSSSGCGKHERGEVSLLRHWIHHVACDWTGTSYPHPSFCESLMSWPIGWTELAPLETGRFQLWRQRHIGFFQANKEAA
jgi:hypothetical protein